MNPVMDPAVLEALGNTLFAATAATILDAAFGFPLGLWLSRSRSRWRHLAEAIVLLPLAMPPVIGGLVLLMWLGPQGWLGRLSPVNTIAGTVIAQMFVAAPFVVISARAAFSVVDRRLENAARSLGSGRIGALVRVTVPLASRGLATGLVLGWMRCMGEFGATAIVAYHPYTLPTLVFVKVTGEGIPQALPLGLMLGALGALMAVALLRLEGARR
jgi:molybdate/tungstate transport system permease protein